MHNRSETIARLAYAAVVAVAAAWVAGAAFVPLAASDHLRDAASLDSNGINLYSALHTAYGRVCHQMPERSIHIWGAPMAVCARCFGVYAGFIAGLIAYPFARSLDRTDGPPRMWLFIALAPVTIDFLGGYAGLFENTLASRAVTGFIAGAAGAFYTLPGLLSMASSVRRDDKASGY
jgi:uncharacterized membrane protein